MSEEMFYETFEDWLNEARRRKAEGHVLLSSDPGAIGFFDETDQSQHNVNVWRVKDAIGTNPDFEWVRTAGGRQAWFKGDPNPCKEINIGKIDRMRGMMILTPALLGVLQEAMCVGRGGSLYSWDECLGCGATRDTDTGLERAQPMVHKVDCVLNGLEQAGSFNEALNEPTTLRKIMPPKNIGTEHGCGWKAVRPRRPDPDGAQARDEAGAAYDQSMGWGSGVKTITSPPPPRRIDGSARPIMLGHKWWGAVVHGSPQVGDPILVRSSRWGGWYTKVHKILSIYKADATVAVVEVWPDRPAAPDVPPNPLITDKPPSDKQLAMLQAMRSGENERWHKGTLGALVRQGLVQKQGGHYVLTQEGVDLMALVKP
jgi:hypothetical protein